MPSALLEQLHLQAGAAVGLVIDHGRLVVEPSPKPYYTLAEEEREWPDAPAAGKELL